MPSVRHPKLNLALVGALASALMIAGCARRSGLGAVDATSTAEPTVSDSVASGQPIPTIATDQLPSDVLVGTLLATSAGPCYLIETDNGRPYALYLADGGPALERGKRVRVKVAPQTQPVTCAPGTLMRIVKLEAI